MFKELGYYTCDGKVFETKLQAMLYANPKNLSITWHFNDEYYNAYDWSIEPEQSLDDLYDLRARQIREQYDYVILSYSGGSDSNNILESFLRQNLFIDEIITNWALDASSKFIVCDKDVKETWNNNAEFHLHTTHRLNYIRNKSPKTKISVLDTSKSIIDGLLNGNDANWVETKNDVFNVTGAFQFNPLFFSEVRKRFDGLGRVAYVLGIEKPRLTIRDNKLYLYFIDKASSIAPVKDSITQYSNITPVLFYWSPDTRAMLAKQAHTVFKYIKSHPIAKQLWQSNDFNIIRRVQEEFLKYIIYTTWDSRWFQVKKTTNDWDSELDYWFTRGWSDTNEYAIWRDGLMNLLPRIKNFVAIDRGVLRGTKPCLSKLHYIGSF